MIALRVRSTLPRKPSWKNYGIQNWALSTQVLQEFCVSVRRKAVRPLNAAEIRGIVQDYSRWHIVMNTPESVLRALENESRFRISFWDALIVQAAEESGAVILYSEDLSHGQQYGPVRVVNPFVSLGA